VKLGGNAVPAGFGTPRKAFTALTEMLKLFGSLAATVPEGPDRERRLRTAIRAAMSEYD